MKFFANAKGKYKKRSRNTQNNLRENVTGNVVKNTKQMKNPWDERNEETERMCDGSCTNTK